MTDSYEDNRPVDFDEEAYPHVLEEDDWDVNDWLDWDDWYPELDDE